MSAFSPICSSTRLVVWFRVCGLIDGRIGSAVIQYRRCTLKRSKTRATSASAQTHKASSSNALEGRSRRCRRHHHHRCWSRWRGGSDVRTGQHWRLWHVLGVCVYVLMCMVCRVASARSHLHIRQLKSSTGLRAYFDAFVCARRLRATSMCD